MVAHVHHIANEVSLQSCTDSCQGYQLICTKTEERQLDAIFITGYAMYFLKFCVFEDQL